MLALYRKYRPLTFDEMAGQEAIKQTLSNEIALNSVAHAYLFSGPRAVGKTTSARIVARAINCLKRKEGTPHPCNECEACQSILAQRTLDVIEIDAASHTGVDNVRENIIAAAKVANANLKYKVFIIDEVHMLSTSAFNALLKLLEEPPANVVFILATTELHKVPATVISRCQRFTFKKIPAQEMKQRLKELCKREKREVEDPVLDTIVRLAGGCQRDAESLLGQVLSLGEGKIDTQKALSLLPTSHLEVVQAVVGHISKNEIKEALTSVQEIAESGGDLEIFVGDVVDYVRNILLLKSNAQDLVEMDEQSLANAQSIAVQTDMRQLLMMVKYWMEAQRDAKWFSIPMIPLEMAIIKSCQEGEVKV